MAPGHLKLVCADVRVWGDFGDTKELVGDLGLATGVQYSEERPQELAYMKLLDVGDQALRSFGSAVIPDAVVLHLIRPMPDGPWLVWGIRQGGGEPASRIFLD
jgi:hypothetical protein